MFSVLEIEKRPPANVYVQDMTNITDSFENCEDCIQDEIVNSAVRCITMIYRGCQTGTYYLLQGNTQQVQADIQNPVGWTVSVSGIFTYFPGIPGTPSVGFQDLEKCLVASVLPDQVEPELVMVSYFQPEEFEYGCGSKSVDLVANVE